jgi:hypothetical protein
MTWMRVKNVTILSIVLVMFLCYPLLTKLSLSALKCIMIGERRFLLSDLQEPCFEGRHLNFLYALSIPQIVIYIMGIPMIATWLIVRSGPRKLHSSDRLHTRYSLLFVGYVNGREWWEAVIVVRKVSIVILSTFGAMIRSIEKTACISLIIIFCAIIAHLLGKPFGTETARAWRLHLLELMALFVVWFINWGGLMLYLGAPPPVLSFLTFLIVFSIACYLCGALCAYCYSLHEKRQEKKREQRRSVASTENNDDESTAGLGSIVQVIPVRGEITQDQADRQGQEGEDEEEVSSLPYLPQQPQHVPGGNTLLRSMSTIRKAESVAAEYHVHEERLRQKLEKRASKQRRTTQQRLRARMLLRRTKTLSKVEIFRHLESDAIDALLKAMEYEIHAEDTEIITQGDFADAFFVIVRGHCGVFVNATKVTLLKSLDMFGENSLVDALGEQRERVRNATVRVESETAQVLKLTREKFELLIASGELGAEVLEKAKHVSLRRINSLK